MNVYETIEERMPVQVDGVAWWYKGDSLIPMPEDVRRDIYYESGYDFSDDICKNATLDDLDEAAIDVFRKTWAYSSRNKRILNISSEQLLRDCGAFRDAGVTYAALILFGSACGLRKNLTQAEICFEYRSSEAAGPAAQRVDFREGFFKCYDKVLELINNRNDDQHYQEGFHVFGVPTFNERVVREAILKRLVGMGIYCSFIVPKIVPNCSFIVPKIVPNYSYSSSYCFSYCS